MTTTTGGGRAPVSRRTPPPPPISRHETLIDLLTQAKRDSVPIRTTFVQQGKGKDTKPGPLASFVSKHDERALDAYLFAHALASAEPWNCDYPSSMWIRALGLGDDAEPASAQAAASKIMKRLEDRKLITRERVGRTSSITLLSEDGSGDAYTHPATARQQYLQLPHAYWIGRHYETLSLPAKAILIVALSLRARFPLPYERGPAWYGLSPDSTERGLRDLEKAGLLDYDQEWIKNHRSPTGWIEQRLYFLREPYLAKPRKRGAAKKPAGKKAAPKKAVAKKTQTKKPIKRSRVVSR
jgi:hypothetical protein